MPDRRKIAENALARSLALFPEDARDPFTATPSDKIATLAMHVYKVANIYGTRGDYPRTFAWVDLLHRSLMIDLDFFKARYDGWRTVDETAKWGQVDPAFSRISDAIGTLRLVRRRPAEEPEVPELRQALRWQVRLYDQQLKALVEENPLPWKQAFLRYPITSVSLELAQVIHGAMTLNDATTFAAAMERKEVLDAFYLAKKTPEQLLKANIPGWLGNRMTEALVDLDLDTYSRLQAIMVSRLPGRRIPGAFSLGAVSVMLAVEARGGDASKLRGIEGVPEGFTLDVWWAAGRR